MYDTFRQIIEKKGITPYRVAKDTGISPVSLTDWKMGRSTPKVDKLIRIANYLDVPLDELLEEMKVRE